MFYMLLREYHHLIPANVPSGRMILPKPSWQHRLEASGSTCLKSVQQGKRYKDSLKTFSLILSLHSLWAPSCSRLLSTMQLPSVVLVCLVSLVHTTAAQAIYKTNSLCTTLYGTKSVPPKSTGYKITIPITFKRKTTVTPTVTVTPPPVTTTTTSSTTVCLPWWVETQHY